MDRLARNLDDLRRLVQQLTQRGVSIANQLKGRVSIARADMLSTTKLYIWRCIFAISRFSAAAFS